MKKITAILLCIIMLVACFPTGVFAATDDSQVSVEDIIDDTVRVSLSSGSASAHNEVTLDLSLDSNPGFAVMILNLSYGSENISLKSVECNADGVSVEFSNESGASTLAFYHLGSDCTATGTLATLTFSIGAYSGDATVTVSAEEGDICNSNAEVVETQFTSGVISVACDHTYVYKGRTEPSCSKEGEIRYVCTICGNAIVTLIDKTAHLFSEEKQVITEPDCDTEGLEAPVCEYCFTIDEDNKDIVPALGHKYYGDPIITKNPTCTEDGSQYQDCYVCNHREVTPITALGHDEGTWRTTYPADCVNSGLASLYCNRCDSVLETREKTVGQHLMAWAVTKKPTCSEEGLEEYLCLVCGGESSDSRTIAALEHTPGEEIVVKEPTCSQAGLAETHCKDCDFLMDSREIEKTEHIKNTLTVITAPTSTSEGAGGYRCKNCGETVETVTIPVTNGVIYIETTPTLAGKSTEVKVYVKENPGFSVGIVTVKYDVTSLIYDGVTADGITADITDGIPAAGEIAILVSLENAQYTENGLLFTLNFTITENAENGTLELSYDPQNDFSAENGDRVFFNMESGEIEILEFVQGDCDGDGLVNTSDLAALKLYLAGATETIETGADIDKNGKIDTGDLAGLKLHLAGVPQF